MPLIDLAGLGHFKDKENEMIAADYSATKTYAVGDYVYYNGVLKRCITAITTAEAYTAAHWANAVLAGDVSEIKTAITEQFETIDHINDLLSYNDTLLSSSLSDKTNTSQGVTYSLINNVLSFSGSTGGSGESLFTILGSTSAAPPSWMVGGNIYSFKLNITDENCLIRFQCKQTSNTSIHSFATFNKSGVYIVEIPLDITAFRLVANVPKNTAVNGTATIEISSIVGTADIPEIKMTISDIAEDLSLKDNLLSQSLSDKSSTSSGITYTMVGNTITLSGAATGISAFTVLGGSTAEPPAWMKAKEKYIVHIENNTPAEVALQYKSTTVTSIQSFAVYKENGDYIVTIPDNITVFRLQIRIVGSAESPIAVDGTIKIEVSNILNVDSVQPKIKKPKIQYMGTVTTTSATEGIYVYIPALSGYIQYRLLHFIDDDINCNCWQIYRAYKVDDYLSNSVQLTATAEWECALHLADRDDFSGGHSHGDEILKTFNVIVNGKPVTLESLSTLTEFNELRIIRTTSMYDPLDHTTVIADHGVEYIFNDKLTIMQSVLWKGSYSLTNCFMAMNPPLKSIVDRAVFNNDFEIVELPSETSTPISTSIVKPKATVATMWDTSTGYSTTLEIADYPTGLTGGDQASVSDNDNNAYNKVYFKVCGGGSSSNGELWKSKSIYSYNYKPSNS